MQAGSRLQRVLASLRAVAAAATPSAAPACQLHGAAAAQLPLRAGGLQRAWTQSLGGLALAREWRQAQALAPGGFAAATAAAAAGSRGFAAQAAGLKHYKPVTPGQRGRVTTVRDNLWKGRPLRALTKGLRKSGGRNNSGRITAYQKGGGARRLYRQIDFKRRGERQGTVLRVEYDPNRSARIALVEYAPKECAYIVAPHGLGVGDKVSQGAGSGVVTGSCLALSAIPVGSQVHNVELVAGNGAKMVRSAGTSATLLAKQENGYALLRMPSGEQRLVRLECRATIGEVGNKEHKNRKIGKAGISRHLGRRPHVRGVAMNPIDHPHGGGEGKSSGGRPSCSPWGVPTKGFKTRRNPRTDKFIVADRRLRK